MTQYYFTPHVYMCVTDDHAVLLDLRQHKYFGLDASQMRVLAGLIPGLLREKFPESPEGSLTEAERGFVAELLNAQILTTDGAIGKTASAVSVPQPQYVPARPAFGRGPRVGFRDVWRFVGACLRARSIIRRRRLEDAAALRIDVREQSATPDAHQVDRLATVFRRCRPFFFTTVDACLFDSLALFFFLARYGVAATCVLGVKTRPFGAHAWVQYDAQVLNDAPEFVRRYTPIFAFQQFQTSA